MSIAVWANNVLGYPRWDEHQFADERRTGVVAMSGGRYEQRYRRDPRRFRSYSISLRLRTDAQRDAVDAFFVSLGYGADSFLVEDPRRRVVTGLAMGTANGSQTDFVIPATGDYGGIYPQNVSLTRLYDDGTSIARTVGTDTRTLSATGGAPALNSVMTADVAFYLRVVLRSPIAWTPLGEGAAWATSMTWEEVPA